MESWYITHLGDVGLRGFRPAIAKKGYRDGAKEIVALEKRLEIIYGVAVMLAQDREHITGVAQVWEAMTDVGERFIEHVRPFLRRRAYHQVYERMNHLTESARDLWSLHTPYPTVRLA